MIWWVMAATQTVNASDLNVQQLDRLKSQLEEVRLFFSINAHLTNTPLIQDVHMLTTSVSQMKMVQNKLTDSKESIEHLTADNSGMEGWR